MSTEIDKFRLKGIISTLEENLRDLNCYLELNNDFTGIIIIKKLDDLESLMSLFLKEPRPKLVPVTEPLDEFIIDDNLEF